MSLKLGIMLDSYNVPFWVNTIIDRVLDNPNIELKLVVLNNGDQSSQKRTFLQKVIQNKFLYHRYLVWERKRISSYLETLKDCDISKKLEDVSCLPVIPIGKKFVHRFEPEDVAKIKEHQLDVILRFGFKIIKGEILNTAGLGVWSYHHGDNDEYRGGPAGFWELYENNPLSGVTLQVLSEKLDGGIVLNKINRRTDPTSPLRNRYSLQETGVMLLMEALNFVALQNFTPEQFYSYYSESSRPYNKKLYRGPKNWQMIFFIGKMFFCFFKKRVLENNKREQWNIGVIQRGDIELKNSHLENVHWYIPDESRFVADPFIVTRNDQVYLFVEDYLYKNKRGHIAVIEMDKNHKFSKPYPVLETDFHLSFPFMLEHDNELYMIPEQAQSNQIVLYQCTEFPKTWVEKKVLFDDFPAVDTVLYFYKNKWWLFTTRIEPCNKENNLFIYHSDSLWGEWTSHSLNPVKTDIRGSRMAGNIFLKDGKMIRPAQNGLKRYGGSVIFYEILTLSENEFEERTVCEILPEKSRPFSDAFHTINFSDTTITVDGSRAIRKY
jgi:hypothetical protein